VTAANMLPGNQTIAYTLTGLNTVGALIVQISGGTFKDQHDDPASPSLFLAAYYVELSAQALPTPLASTLPFGAQVYSTTASNQLLYATNSNRFTLAADPGQTLTVLVTPTSGTLTPAVQVSDPSSTVLGSASASGPGQNALIQTVPTTTSGTYTITVNGLSSTIGSYTVLVYLDAAVEAASQGLGIDTTAATAQNLNPSFVTLQTSLASASRSAVIGSVGQPLTIKANAFGFWDSTGYHLASVPSFEVGQKPPYQYNNFFVFNLSGVNPTILTATLNLTVGPAGYSSSQSSDTYGLFDVTTPLAALEATGYGQVGIFTDLGTGTSYGTQTVTAATNGTILATPLNAAGVAALNSKRGSQFAVGGALTTLTGSNYQYLFDGSGNASDTIQLALTLADTRFYSFTLGAQELATVGLKNLTGSGDTITIQNSSGTTLATGVAGAANLDQVINNFVAPTAGTYYVVVSGSTQATYDLVVTRDATFDQKNNATFATAQNITTTTGAVGALGGNQVESITISATGGTFTVSYGGKTTPSQAYNVSATSLQAALQGLSSIGANNVAVSLSGSVYTLTFQNALGNQALLNVTTNPVLLTGGAGTATVATVTPGAPGPVDWYLASLSSSLNALQVETRTPLGGPSQAINSLIPSIQLYNSSDTLIASGTLLGDGRNQSLLATGLTPGAAYYVKVTSANGAAGEYFLGVVPLQAPAVMSSPANQNVVAGQPVTFSAAASGAPTPTVQWQVSTNGGTTYTPVSGATSTTFTIAATTTGQNGNLYEAVFTNPAGSATTAAAHLTVTAAPVFTKYLVTAAIGSSTVAAGNSFQLQVQAADQFGNPMTSNYTGPPTVTATISPTSSASSFPTPVSIGNNGFGVAVVSFQQVGTYTITAASGTYTGSVGPMTVIPAPAAKLAFAVPPVNTPTGNLLPAVTVQVQDQFGNLIATDNTDQVTIGIASGPGAFLGGSTTTATVVGGTATFSNLTLVKPGTYQLSENVPSFYTGPNSAAFTIAPLQVLPGTFASTPSGFSLQFNAPFLVNSVTPALYGLGFGSTAPVPSVTLYETLNASGMVPLNPPGNTHNTRAPLPIAGSLVLNTTTNTITFVATDTTLYVNSSTGSPVLPDGTYKVDVTSSAATNGFQAINNGGGFLDGLGTGTAGSGDYKTTFTVNAAASNDDVVWVPATADGPGQALDAPGNNQVNNGYPVYLSDSTGSVTNVQVTLNYNPALLTVTGATGLNFTMLGSSTPGHAVLQYSNGTALTKGPEIPLGYITASVPSGTTATPMPYKAKDLLTLTGLSVSGTHGSVPVIGGNALHLVAYVADSDGNGVYTSNDAVLITRVSLQTDTGFAAYPLVDPVIVADTDGSGFLPADAALQANEAGIGFPTANLAIPPIPFGVHFAPIANNVDPAVSIPTGLHVGASGTVTVPVNIDDAHPAGSSGLTEAHLALTYDPSLFSVSAADVHLGSVLAAGSGWSVESTINPGTGQIAIALSSTTPITSTLGGSLVTIDFHQADQGEPAGVSRRIPESTAFALVASVNPSGQQTIMTELEDAQGTFTLTPAPTNDFDSRIDGVVLLAATSTAAPVPPAVVEAAALGTTAAADNHDADGRVAAAPDVETTSPALPVVTAEASTQVLFAGGSGSTEMAPVHVSIVAVTSFLASTNLGTLTSAPLAGLVFQFATVPAALAPGAGMSVAQHAADQWFLALARATANSSELPMVFGTVKDGWERLLANPLLLLQPPLDNLDGLNWETAGSAQDGQGADCSPALAGSRGAADSLTLPATDAHAALDLACLDQYFAQTADAPAFTDE